MEIMKRKKPMIGVVFLSGEVVFFLKIIRQILIEINHFNNGF